MNNHLKLAYDYGVGIALAEAGLTKTAETREELRARYLSSPLATLEDPEGFSWNPEDHYQSMIPGSEEAWKQLHSTAPVWADQPLEDYKRFLLGNLRDAQLASNYAEQLGPERFSRKEAGITKTANMQLMQQYMAQGMHPQDAMDKAYPDVVRDKAIYDATTGGNQRLMSELNRGDVMDQIRDAALMDAVNRTAVGTSQVNRQNFEVLLDKVRKSNSAAARRAEGRRASAEEIANTARFAGAGGGLIGAGSGALVGGGLGALLGESLGYDSARAAGIGALLGGAAGGGLGGYAGHKAVKTLAD